VGEPHVVTLRATRAGDLDALFDVRQARWDGFIDDPATIVRTVRADGAVVGGLAVWHDDEGYFVEFRFDGWHGGRPLVMRALRLLLEDLAERPLHARVAVGDVETIAVLEHFEFRRADDGRYTLG
jgi:RimJ/RimL family protein N-acetyltransferase